MVRRSHRDGPGSANQAPRPRASGTNGPQTYPRWGSVVEHRTRPGACDGLACDGRGGVWVCSVTLTWFLLVWKETQEPGLRLVTARRVTTWSGDWSATALTWFHEWAGGCSWATTCCLAREEEGSDPVMHSSQLSPLGTQRLRKPLLNEVLGTAGFWANGGTKTRYSTRPSSGGGRGAVTISQWAVSSLSGSPVSGPLALALAARFGGGLDGLGVLPATGSTTLPGERLLRQRGSEGGRRGRPRRRASWGLQPGWKQQVSSGAWCVWTPQSASVLPRTAGQALDSVAEEAGLWHGSIQELYLLLLLHVSETQPEMALLDH